MKNNMRKLFTVTFGILFAVSTFALPSRLDQPFMEKAKDNLRDAKSFLNRATPDKGGHRNRAIEFVNKAVAAVNSGIAFDRTHLGNRPRRNSTEDEIVFEPVASAGADQPNMVKAREELQNAINNLNRASADKGGWRNKALDYTRDALRHVNDGIEYDRTH